MGQGPDRPTCFGVAQEGRPARKAHVGLACQTANPATRGTALPPVLL